MRVKETIKRLEGESFFKPEKESVLRQEKWTVPDLPEPKRTFFKEDFDSPWKYPGARTRDSDGDAVRE